MISSASSGSFSSRCSMMLRSVVRSALFTMATTASMPPAIVKSCPMTVLSLRSSTRSTSRSTSGVMRSIRAMRLATSACMTAGRPLRIIAA